MPQAFDESGDLGETDQTGSPTLTSAETTSKSPKFARSAAPSSAPKSPALTATCCSRSCACFSTRAPGATRPFWWPRVESRVTQGKRLYLFDVRGPKLLVQLEYGHIDRVSLSRTNFSVVSFYQVRPRLREVIIETVYRAELVVFIGKVGLTG